MSHAGCFFIIFLPQNITKLNIIVNSRKPTPKYHAFIIPSLTDELAIGIIHIIIVNKNYAVIRPITRLIKPC